MKREYMKPTMNVVELQHQHQLLAGSITDVQTTGLGDGDDFTIDDTPAGDGFWNPQAGRGCDSLASHNEENLGNNKFNFKNKTMNSIIMTKDIKRTYLKPSVEEVKLKQRLVLLAGSDGSGSIVPMDDPEDL